MSIQLILQIFVKSVSTTIEKTIKSIINESTITPDPTNIEKPISTLNRITTIPDSKNIEKTIDSTIIKSTMISISTNKEKII